MPGSRGRWRATAAWSGWNRDNIKKVPPNYAKARRAIAEVLRPSTKQTVPYSRKNSRKPKSVRWGFKRPYVIHVDDAYYISNHESLESAMLKANREIMRWRVGAVLRVHNEYDSYQPDDFVRYVLYKIERTTTSFRILFRTSQFASRWEGSGDSPGRLDIRRTEHSKAKKELSAPSASHREVNKMRWPSANVPGTRAIRACHFPDAPLTRKGENR
jgi:hypothetical protein